MSDHFLDEFCAKLEAAIAENETQSAAVDREFNGHLIQLSRRLEVLADTIKNHKHAADVLRQSFVDEIAALRMTRTTNEAGTVAEDGTGDRQLRIEQLEKEHAEQLEAIQAGRRRVDELISVIEQREESLKQAQDRMAKLEEALASTQSEVETLRQNHKTTGDVENGLQAELEAVRSELDQARSEIDNLRNSAETIGTAERLLDSERERANELEARLNQETSDGTKALIAQHLADALREAEESRAEAAALRAALDTLQRNASAPDETVQPVADDRMITPRRSKWDRDTTKRQMDEILLEAGAITQDQLDDAVVQQMEQPKRSLAEILVEQKAASEEVIAQALAAQHRVLYVRLTDQTIDPAAALLINARIARQHRCIPIRATEEALVLAMVDPLNVIAIEDVERASSRAVRPVMATRSEIANAIDRLYAEPADTSA